LATDPPKKEPKFGQDWFLCGELTKILVASKRGIGNPSAANVYPAPASGYGILGSTL
jgi:hypothetical protein